MSKGTWVWEIDDTPGWGGLVASLRNLDGVSWREAPIPRRLHRCRAQTVGREMFIVHERCACGALRSTHARPREEPVFRSGSWHGKNSRRRETS